jgi:hypothetical protein
MGGATPRFLLVVETCYCARWYEAKQNGHDIIGVNELHNLRLVMRCAN